jgi:MgsA AAA+ ATPase C terminal
MPRLYGPGHFTEDPYSQVVSPHGIPVDDLVAVLQKEIRRSRIDNAVLAAYEMFTTSADVAQHLWRRLRLIAVEDVGMGLPLGPVLIDVLHRNFNATPGGEWMMACHAVRLLASAPKDRTSSEHADWVAAKVALGEALVEVPDYAHCVHTRAGQELGRGLMQWWDNGAQVRDELPSADHRYRAELIEIHRRDEAENGTAPRPLSVAETVEEPAEEAAFPGEGGAGWRCHGPLASDRLVIVCPGDSVNDLGLVEVLGAVDLRHVANQHAVAHDLGFEARGTVGVPLGFAAAGQ